jgi:hypothetical protein
MTGATMRKTAGTSGADATAEALMAARGWVKFPSLIGPDALEALRADAERVYGLRRELQIRNGVAEGMEGVAHHIAGEGGVLDRLLDNLPLYEQIEGHFGGKVILLNYGATLHPPGTRSYTFKPHRDVRAFTRDFPLSINMLVMLDDFTVENGATLLLSGSHRVEAMPTPDAFADKAEHAVGRAGDVLLFDSLLVHAAAPNHSQAARRALTLCFGRPFMKPQMDWVGRFGRDAEAGLSPMARQLLGYHARVPESLDDFYQPPERWAFKPDQR